MNPEESAQRWRDAAQAAALFAVDPVGTGGIVLRAHAGPAREHWLDGLRASLPPAMALRRVPLHIGDDRLLGGLDLAASLHAGRPIAERGVLAQADGGIVLLAMAERLAPSTAARITAVLDAQEVVVERDGLALSHPSSIGVIALDEGVDTDEAVAEALRDRLAFHIDLAGLRPQDAEASPHSAEQIAAARLRLCSISGGDAATVEALCETALALGILSIRAVLLSLRVARSAAALGGRDRLGDADVALAARLVLAPRATQLPSSAAEPDDRDSEDEEADDQPPQSAPKDSQQASATQAPSPSNESTDKTPPDADESEQHPDKPMAELLLAATLAAIPNGLLAGLKPASAANARARSTSKAGLLKSSSARGRPAGTRRGEPRPGVRLNLIETLRAAAPWQRLRHREAGAATDSDSQARRVLIRRDDFHVSRYKKRSESTTIFVVDASGSSALNRLAEAKGAVELLLADCYVRRDRVALIAFRGRGAELLLPPTRSLVRAKRSLAGLPGGGGTPLAAGIDAALALADVSRRRGESTTLVLLTDGRANVASDGSSGDRARAESDALAAAKRLQAAGLTVLFIDTSPRPQALAARLAEAMRARYLPLPYADAATLSAAVKAAGSSAASRASG